ncbi:MAG: tRNA (N(6)-L-threonylcarbamoyladenosine(37)-C(2))-methylthiotransferase MtaB [Chlamydiota bacterium]
MEKKKYKVATLGCRTNQYESQAYTDQLRAMGYVPAGEGEAADLCIVNTCTVTASADSSSRHQIRKLALQNPGSKLVVTGCFVENYKDEIAKIEGVTDIIPNKQKEDLLSLIFPDMEVPEFAIEHFAAHTRAFVKVQDGCESYCTYCTIPYTRGRSRSRRLVDILKEVHTLIANGYKEIVLTGVNIGDFDGAPVEGEPRLRLVDLVRAVDEIEGLKRLRISSIDPDEVDKELVDAILGGKTCCPSMHIVLQSGSNVILKRMNRKYTRQIFIDTIEYLRSREPEFTFTTDIIVGFPGETEVDFQETLEMMDLVKFAKVHMFPYSDRKRTRASLYPNKVPQDVMAARKALLLRKAEEISFSLRQEYVGKKMSVLIEAEERPGFFSGHTENFLQVLIPGTHFRSNDLIEVTFVSNTPEGLIGHVD